MRGIEEMLWRVGYACVLADTNNVPEREVELVGQLRDRGCDGFIISSVLRNSPIPEQLAKSNIAAVLVTQATDGLSLPLATSDDVSGINAQGLISSSSDIATLPTSRGHPNSQLPQCAKQCSLTQSHVTASTPPTPPSHLLLRTPPKLR